MRPGRAAAVIVLCVAAVAPVVAAAPAPAASADRTPVELGGARTAGARGLTVSFVGAPAVTDPDDPCQVDYRASARESGGRVRVAVRPVVRAVHRRAGCVDLGVFRTVTLRLDRPVGDRTVVDAATGAVVPVFDGAARLRPGWLPAGWTVQGEGAGGCWSSEPVPCWHQTWGTPEREDADACDAGTGYVQLAQLDGPTDPGAFAPDPAVTTTTATVRGAPAEVRVDPRGPGTVTVRWAEGSQSLVLLGGASCSGAPAPTADVVLRIADHLR